MTDGVSDFAFSRFSRGGGSGRSECLIALLVYRREALWRFAIADGSDAFGVCAWLFLEGSKEGEVV